MVGEGEKAYIPAKGVEKGKKGAGKEEGKFKPPKDIFFKASVVFAVVVFRKLGYKHQG